MRRGEEGLHRLHSADRQKMGPPSSVVGLILIRSTPLSTTPTGCSRQHSALLTPHIAVSLAVVAADVRVVHLLQSASWCVRHAFLSSPSTTVQCAASHRLPA